MKVIKERLLKEVPIPETVFKKSKKLKIKTNPSGVVLKEIPDEVVQETKKRKAVGVLKHFKKLRALTVKETLPQLC